MRYCGRENEVGEVQCWAGEIFVCYFIYMPLHLRDEIRRGRTDIDGASDGMEDVGMKLFSIYVRVNQVRRTLKVLVVLGVDFFDMDGDSMAECSVSLKV